MPVRGPTESRSSNLVERPAPKNKVHGAVLGNVLMVNYTDGKGRTETRLVIDFGDNHKYFLFPDALQIDEAKAKVGKRIEEVMRPPQDWVIDGIEEALGRRVVKPPQKAEVKELRTAAVPPVKVLKKRGR